MNPAIRIFDTTLRDGEQSPGFGMHVKDKVRFARQLVELNVDIIEAGFPAASEEDFIGVEKIAQEIRGPVIAAFARGSEKDIDQAWQAVKFSRNPRIHIVYPTSDIHLQYKLKKSREQGMEEVYRSILRAKKYVEDIEFSAEDATRTDRDYLLQVLSLALEAGAQTLNIPDTVGYTLPEEYGSLIEFLKAHLIQTKGFILSVHCHDDLGLGVANSLAAIQHGAMQVECTVNGIGERAGNSALEEIVMAIKVRKDSFGCITHVVTEKLCEASELLSEITGVSAQPNKAIVGANAFAHEAGIHQDGIMKNRLTYEIMTPETVGWKKNSFILGRHSGRHALAKKLQELGYHLNELELKSAFDEFKHLANIKKQLGDEDLRRLIHSIH